jgi:ubiquinone/menaquinone biosynthesis C-methylase UbiE
MDIILHYQKVAEQSRLAEGVGPLELARTQEVIRRYLPKPPSTILDIGGGPGIYASWLTDLGCTVHLVDPVPGHVEQARLLAVAGASIGDARSLAFANEFADVVLLLGPLYHLTERADRIRALAESWRVLRPGGTLFAAAISRFASLLDGLFRGLIDAPAFCAIVDRDLREGQHRNPTGNPAYFTTAFFHRAEELAVEVREAGFSLTDIVAVEGPGWLVADFENRWGDARRRQQLLDLIRQVEHEPAMLAISHHVLAVARKKG